MIPEDPVKLQIFRIPAFLERPAAAAAWVALAYVAVARASILFSFQSSHITPIFPAAGIALVAALVLGRPGLAGVFFGAFLNLVITLGGIKGVSLHTAPSILLVSLIVSLGKTAGAGAGAFLVRRYGRGIHPLSSGRNVIILAALGALGCTTISTTIGVLGWAEGGFSAWTQVGFSWLIWWVGDAAGTIIAAPLILAALQPRSRRPVAGGPMEACALAAVHGLFSYGSFFLGWPIAFAIIPLSLWAAIRFGTLGASISGAATAVLATIGSGLGLGGLVQATPTQTLLLLHGFLAVTNFTALFMAGLLEERDRLEEAERSLTAQLRAIVENSHDGIVFMDADGVVVYQSPSAEAIIGYKPEERMGLNGFEVIHPEDEPTTRQVWTDVLSQPETVRHLEFRTRHKDGTWVWVEASIRNLLANPDVRAVVATVRDLTERKRAEHQVRKISAAVGQSSASIVITDTAGIIEYVNPRFSLITGYSAEEALGQHTRILKSGAQPSECYQELWATITAGQVWHGEFQNRKKNGDLFWELATVAPIQDERGAITGYVAVKDDITARKHDGEEHARLQAQLLQAQKLESVGRLAGGVAHDFNNMLSVILSNSELALHQLGPGHPAGEKLEVIVKATQRSADLTRQLLAFARQQPVLPKVLDLNLAIEGMLRMLRRIIGEDIAIAWIPGLHLWRTVMDPTQLDQILANLLVNARDAIKGEGKVTITTQNVHLDQTWSDLQMEARVGDFVLITVSDDGCGMDDETQKRIFEPFFTTKGMGQGTGLGLSTVYGSVHQSGGFINVYSEPRLGTTFKIYLPRYLGAEQEPASHVEVAGLPRGTETVVLVEDNSVLLQSIAAVLGALGYNVFPVSGPKEAIRLAQEFPGPLHLLLTDVVMPGMNGRDLAQALHSVCPGIKCLYMSGYTADIISRHGILNEGLQFIQKPFSSHDFANKLRNVLDAGQA
jgi:PAS domain S-box-containing protein